MPSDNCDKTFNVKIQILQTRTLRKLLAKRLMNKFLEVTIKLYLTKFDENKVLTFFDKFFFLN